jgi:hypothetical protein
VLDFGIAKTMLPEESRATLGDKTRDDISSFSLSHAAPEQVARMRTGPWTDVHSLALLLVEVLAGRRAYRAESNLALFSAITAAQRPTPASVGLRVGPWEQTLAGALSLDVRERPAHARALLDALERGLDEAQRAWDSPSRGPRTRVRSVVALGAVLALVAVGAVATMTRVPRAQDARAATASAVVAGSSGTAPSQRAATSLPPSEPRSNAPPAGAAAGPTAGASTVPPPAHATGEPAPPAATRATGPSRRVGARPASATADRAPDRRALIEGEVVIQ